MEVVVCYRLIPLRARRKGLQLPEFPLAQAAQKQAVISSLLTSAAPFLGAWHLA